jgi:hypothetical protein
MPVFAIIFSEMLQVFSKPTDEMLAGARFWSLMFVVLAVGMLVANYLQASCFGTRLNNYFCPFETNCLLMMISYNNSDIGHAIDAANSQLVFSGNFASRNFIL